MSDESKKSVVYERINTLDLDIYLNTFTYIIEYDDDNIKICIDDFPCEERLNLGVILKYFNLTLIQYYEDLSLNKCQLNKVRDECIFIIDVDTYKTKFLPLFGQNTQEHFNKLLESSKK